MRPCWVAVACGLAVATLAGQAPPPTTIGFAVDATHISATFEVDTASNGLVPCVSTAIVGNERTCLATFSRQTAQVIRLRAVNVFGAGPWGAPVAAAAVPPGSPPGLYTITLARPVRAPVAPMATRIYLPSTGAPSISPAFGGTWGSSPNADRMTAVTTRIGSAMTNKAGNPDAGENVTQLLRQYIIGPLATQNISGTVKGQVRLLSTTAATWAPALRVAKCNADGSVVTQIMAIQSEGTAMSPNSSTSLRNQRFGQGTNDFTLELSSTDVDEGDFLILEVGFFDPSPNVGRTATLNFGDDSGTDLPEDETTTTANNPWLEFSDDLDFNVGGATGQPIAKRFGDVPFTSGRSLFGPRVF